MMVVADVEGTAPGKLILFGEHAVVYGQPAIAVPVPGVQARAVVAPGEPGQGLLIIAANLGRTIIVHPRPTRGEHALSIAARLFLQRVRHPYPDLQILLHSTIPVASGLGSGAAATAALLRALGQALDCTLPPDDLNALVYEIEKLYHGTPSGIDNTVVVYEQPVCFVRGEPIQTFTVGAPLHLVVADTGVSSPTRAAVDAVRELYEGDPARIQPLFDRIGAITREARVAIEAGEFAPLGPLVQENHALLRELTVSSPELDDLVAAAEAAGAAGAKLSGGGRGGNMFAVAAPERVQAVVAALEAAGAKRVIETTLG